MLCYRVKVGKPAGDACGGPAAMRGGARACGAGEIGADSRENPGAPRDFSAVRVIRTPNAR